MIPFDDAHRAVHYPPDRRFRIWIRPSILAAVAALVLTPLIIAWTQAALFGLPHLSRAHFEDAAAPPLGFPGWVRWSHFFNLLFVFMLMRSGLSILMDHARLYLNDHCTPGTEWLRLTPIKVPSDKVWMAKEDARYITPIVATPGYRHTVGLARAWHFITVYGFVLTGVFFVCACLTSGHWHRLVPTSLAAIPDAWRVFVYYATFHLPPEPNGFYAYNPLQQIAYGATVFLLSPLSILTGLAMSPALDNRWPRYAKIFGGRQCARSIHFLILIAFALFVIVHVVLVALTGLRRNMNHIVLGTDDTHWLGLALGIFGLTIVIATWIVAHYISWFSPRTVQHTYRGISQPLLAATLDRLTPRKRVYRANEISPRLWPNGKIPERGDWKRMAAGGFKDYRLKIDGLVENPIELSLADLRALGTEEVIVMQHCVQGWSGIAQWRGVLVRKLIEQAKPVADANAVAFFSFGAALYAPVYYETAHIVDLVEHHAMLALDMNGAPLTDVYGAPLRLRIDNQLGYKMVKWIERVEFVDSVDSLGEGEGGSGEDDDNYDLLPNI
jgi:methionine sulfoxide reductase catalytic subunit